MGHKNNKQVKTKIKQIKKVEYGYFSVRRLKRLKVLSILWKIFLAVLFFFVIGLTILIITFLISVYVKDKNEDLLISIGYTFFGISVSFILGVYVAIKISLGTANEYFKETESKLFFGIRITSFVDNSLFAIYSFFYSVAGLILLLCSFYVESVVYPVISIISSVILLIRYISYSRKNKYERFHYYLLHSSYYQKTSRKEIIEDYNLMLSIAKDKNIDYKRLYSFINKRIHHINYYIDDLEDMLDHDEDVNKEQNILEDFFVWYSRRITTPVQFFSLIISLQSYLDLLAKYKNGEKCKNITSTVKALESILENVSLISSNGFLDISISFVNIPLEIKDISLINECVFNDGEKIMILQKTFVAAFELLIKTITDYQLSLGIAINGIVLVNEKMNTIDTNVDSNLNSMKELSEKEKVLLDQSISFYKSIINGDYKLEVLIPTHHKSIDDIKEMVKLANIKSPVLVCNQVDSDSNTNIDNIHIVNVSNKGVSNNRNNLLDNSKGDICICIDDDCRLVNNYTDIINNFFLNHPDAEFILFNGIVRKENDRLIHNKKTKRVKRFNDVSYGGGPGLVFKRECISKYNLRYDTSVGYPNYICLGEDTLFLYNLVKSKAVVYRSNEVLFSIEDDVDNSIYFKGVDESFLISKGYVTSIIHPYLKRIYVIKYALHLRRWRGNTYSFFKLIKIMNKGFDYRA